MRVERVDGTSVRHKQPGAFEPDDLDHACMHTTVPLLAVVAVLALPTSYASYVPAVAVATLAVSTFPALARRPHLPAYDVSATAVSEIPVQPSMPRDSALGSPVLG